MILDWLKFLPALVLLLVPIGFFHGPKVRHRPVSLEWHSHWTPILLLRLHWVDLVRAVLGGLLLARAIPIDPEAAGALRHQAPLLRGAIMIAAVGLQTVVCREKDSFHMPFTFVTGLILGSYPPTVAGFVILLSLTLTLGLREPLVYFFCLALSLGGIGFLLEGRKDLVLLVCGSCAVLVPWLLPAMFRKTPMVTYRARRLAKGQAGELAPRR